MIAGDTRVDCIVVGLGPAGLVTALALAREGFRTLAIGHTPTNGRRDLRTTALFAGSVSLLRSLKVWPALASGAAPLTGLRLVDDTGGLLRAPETLFRAGEMDLEAFGYNVENESLVSVLRLQAESLSNITVAAGEVADLTHADDHTTVRLKDGGTASAALVVAADGRGSITRARAGIGVRTWSYPQSAIAARFRHSRPHDGISTEFHRIPGPLTTVPLPGNESSLVWVEVPAEAKRLAELSPEAFARELEVRLQGLLGTIHDVGPRAVFPLSGMTAERFAQHRVALVGEAAHVIPPIGAQGLNLGFRDAACLAQAAADAYARGVGPGDDATLSDYQALRSADVLSRTIAVDLLNRSLISGFLPWHLARGAGLHLIAGIPWLRQLVMREGMHPSLTQPRLMRPALDTPEKSV